MDINTIWFILIGVLFIVYSVLEGFDLGVSMIHLFSKSESKKRLLTNAIAPVWDENEVWIIGAVGGMLAAFPNSYSTVFSGFYLAVIVLMFAIIFRSVGLEIRNKVNSPGWRKGWDVAFGLSGLLIALLLGVALGNVFYGIPLNDKLDTNISFIALLRPYPLVMGLTVVATFYLHGALFAFLKAPVSLEEEFKKLLKPGFALLAVLYVALAAFTFVAGPGKENPGILPAILGGVAIIELLLVFVNINKTKIGTAFIFSTAFIATNWVIIMLMLYPNMVIDSNGINHLTIYNAASSEATLWNMFIIAAIGVPIVIAYTIYLYRVFRGKVNLEEDMYL
jgi:cytochrome d ubiquinol oxidase subunit II